jgi:hypothetical protein
MSLDEILAESNVTRAEADLAIQALVKAQEALEELQPELDFLMNEWTATMIENNNSLLANMGNLLCGDPEAFELKLDLTSFIKTNNVSNSDHDDDVDVELPDLDVDIVPFQSSCELLEAKLKEDDVGKILWRMSAPFLKGHIIYAPDNEMTRSIIEKVIHFNKSQLSQQLK